MPIYIFLCCAFSAVALLSNPSLVMAQDVPAQSEATASAADQSSEELLRLSWKASNMGDMAELDKHYKRMIDLYAIEAESKAAQMKAFPTSDIRAKYKTMNDVATAMFVKAEALMHAGKNDEAKALFNDVSQKFPWSQAWDPSRGSYWSIKEKAQASIRVLEGVDSSAHPIHKDKAPVTTIKLAFPGTEKIVDYTKYGKFSNEGTKEYHYSVHDREGLMKAVGEGIYPNIGDVYRDPAYKKALKEGRLNEDLWQYVNTTDLEAAFYKWATSSEPWGVRLFYLGVILEKAKLYNEAIKAYQALIVHFPGTIAWTYWQTPWYPGEAALAKIRYIIAMHPELNIAFKGARIKILNSFDNDPQNDQAITKPGAIVPVKSFQVSGRKAPRVALGEEIKSLGSGTVRLAKYKSGHWQLLVDGKPYIIKGVTYGPSKVGQSPDKGTLTNWMESDENKNGKIDAPYEAWVDRNNNNVQDPDEKTVGDFALMKEMGVNTIRLYHQPLPIHKELLRKMYKEYGIRVIMGDFLGKYAIGSGAAWADGTDYENPEHQKKMMESVRKMVEEFKDEPYILMWLLGNENNYGVASNADKKPEAFYKFVNEVAAMVKSIDPNHPVAMSNGDTLYLDKMAANAPEVDAYASNAYRGNYGFGSFWSQVEEILDRPVMIAEYGAPAYGGDSIDYDEAQREQAAYHQGNWLDIAHNSAGYADGAGNSIGGIAFAWLDEWWKNYEPALHDTKADVVGPFPAGYYFEEWFGIFGQGNGKSSPFLREPRKVFDMYKKVWNKT